jgi:hypothetical protein
METNHVLCEQWRTEGGGVWGVQPSPHPRNSEVLTKLSRIPSSVENTSITTYSEYGFHSFKYWVEPLTRGYRLQIPVLSALCPQLILLNHPLRKKFLDTPLVRRELNIWLSAQVPSVHWHGYFIIYIFFKKNWPPSCREHQIFFPNYTCRHSIKIPQTTLRGTLLVAQLVEALRHKPEGRRFDSRWRQCNFSLT